MLRPDVARGDAPWSVLASPPPSPDGHDWYAGSVFMTAAGHAGGLFYENSTNLPIAELMSIAPESPTQPPSPGTRFDSGYVTLVKTFGDDGLIAWDDAQIQNPRILIGTPGSGLSDQTPPVSPDAGRWLGGIAANRRGDIAVLEGTSAGIEIWLRGAGSSAFRLVRQPSLKGPRVITHAFSMGPRGDMLLTYSRRSTRYRVLYARRFDSAGRPGHELVVGTARGAIEPAAVQAALESDGRAVVAWRDFSSRATRLRVASAAPRRAFATPRIVSLARFPAASARTAEGEPAVDLSFRFSPTGPLSELLVWTISQDGAVRAAGITRGRVNQAQQLGPSPASSALTGLATAPNGAAVVMWTSPYESPRPYTLYASTRRTTGARFGEPEVVDSEMSGQGSVAIDPTTGRVLASYIAGNILPHLVIITRAPVDP